MYPTIEPTTNPTLFAEKAAAFFALNDLQSFYDAPSALDFIVATDAIVDLFIGEGLDVKVFSDELMLQLGSALGEAFVMVFTGTWEFVASTERWEVGFELPSGDRITINVFHKLEKRFQNGMEDSIGYLFDMIRQVYLDEMSLLPQ